MTRTLRAPRPESRPSQGAGHMLLAATVVASGLVACASEAQAPLERRQLAFSAPSVELTQPTKNQNIDPDTETVEVTLEVEVLGAPGQTVLVWYVNGEELHKGSPEETQQTVTLGSGRHHAAVWLVPMGSDPLDAATVLATDGHHFNVRGACDSLADCEDGHACSSAFCHSGDDRCHYGGSPVEACCDTQLECHVGFMCVDHLCIECLDDDGCNDGNPCTSDSCGADGLCLHDWIAGCCLEPAHCDDGKDCTEDACDVATNSCEHAPSPVEGCCDTPKDCVLPEAPCAAVACSAVANSQVKLCRYGPPAPGCCTHDDECSDGNDCTVDTCAMDQATALSGTCSSVPDPAWPQCCSTAADCDDGNAQTQDLCVAGQCEHHSDPAMCALPQTSPVVIHEIMHTPALPGGQWIELYIAASTPVDLRHWTLTTSPGGDHVLDLAGIVGPKPNLTFVPGVFVVLGQSDDADAYGGMLPHYAWQQGPSLLKATELGKTQTIELRDAKGKLVDAVSYDPADATVIPLHSLALTNPHADNAKSALWAASDVGGDPKSHRIYGDKSLGQHGSPKTPNGSVLAPLPDPSCDWIAAGDGCSFGACDAQSQCVVGKVPGCCQVDADCDDFNPCTADLCDTAKGSCIPSVPVDGCCHADADCDDGEPCSFDRCISQQCRHGGKVPGCCHQDGDCDDDDGCTLDLCDLTDHACLPGQPIIPSNGAVCCAQASDCDDGQAGTLDTCEGGLCAHKDDPTWCADDKDCALAPACTIGVCVASTCTYPALPGCCTVDSDCPASADPCVDVACSAEGCVEGKIAGCCTLPEHCDDGNPCTEDLCAGSLQCHSKLVSGCCAADSDCDDGDACTLDLCVDGACVSAQQVGCCDPLAPLEDLAERCGALPGSTASCDGWLCSADGQCEIGPLPGCCELPEDCDDGNVCTLDVCTVTATCKRLPHPWPPENIPCCASMEDCEAGHFCDDSWACAPQRPDGESCQSDLECTSNHCVDGICCNTACDGTCEACGGDTPGTCHFGCEGSCCGPHDGPGCEDEDTALKVCEQDKSCCTDDWGDPCVDLVHELTEGLCPTGSCCSAGGGAGCVHEETQDCVCAKDPICCLFGWDSACVKAAFECDAQGEVCPHCGDGTCSADETCAMCPDDCGPCTGSCCEAHDQAGCADPYVVGCLCQDHPECCSGKWTDDCVKAIETTPCGLTCEYCGDGFCDPDAEDCESCAADCNACPSCGDGVCDPFEETCSSCAVDCGACIGTCDATNDTPGCADPCISACVCDEDAFCCTDLWDGWCVQGAVDAACEPCGVCGNGACEASETCLDCPGDCGACTPFCEDTCEELKHDCPEGLDLLGGDCVSVCKTSLANDPKAAFSFACLAELCAPEACETANKPDTPAPCEAACLAAASCGQLPALGFADGDIETCEAACTGFEYPDEQALGLLDCEVPSLQACDVAGFEACDDDEHDLEQGCRDACSVLFDPMQGAGCGLDSPLRARWPNVIACVDACMAQEGELAVESFGPCLHRTWCGDPEGCVDVLPGSEVCDTFCETLQAGCPDTVVLGGAASCRARCAGWEAALDGHTVEDVAACAAKLPCFESDQTIEALGACLEPVPSSCAGACADIYLGHGSRAACEADSVLLDKWPALGDCVEACEAAPEPTMVPSCLGVTRCGDPEPCLGGASPSDGACLAACDRLAELCPGEENIAACAAECEGRLAGLGETTAPGAKDCIDAWDHCPGGDPGAPERRLLNCVVPPSADCVPACAAVAACQMGNGGDECLARCTQMVWDGPRLPAHLAACVDGAGGDCGVVTACPIGMVGGCGDSVCAPGETCATCPVDCGACSSSCCEVQAGPGCIDPAVEACVCFDDPFCCNTQFDVHCVVDGQEKGCQVCLGCGDGVCGGDEACDTCPGDCGECDCCHEHDGVGCANDLIESCVCAADPYCCETRWDGFCVGAIEDFGCGVCDAPPCSGADCLPEPICGDTVCESGETCATCPGDCGGCVGACWETHPSPGCAEGAGMSCVCAIDAWCCSTTWDDACVDVYVDNDCGFHPKCGDGSCNGSEDCLGCEADCGACTGCGDGFCVGDESCSSCPDDCPELCEGDCCAANGSKGCGDTDLQSAVCAIDSYCCLNTWDSICVDGVEAVAPGTCDECGDQVCGSSESCSKCPADCGSCDTCGDKICGPSESCSSCYTDCWQNCQAPCCEPHGGEGCNDKDVFDCVCASASECCVGTWDEHCVLVADECGDCDTCGDGTCELTEDCESCPSDCGVCDGCGDGLCDPDLNETCYSCHEDCGDCEGDCCDGHDAEGCGDLDLLDCVCSDDAFCCQVFWDDFCVEFAAEACGLSGCGCDSPPCPEPGTLTVIADIGVGGDGHLVTFHAVHEDGLHEAGGCFELPFAGELTMPLAPLAPGGDPCSVDDPADLPGGTWLISVLLDSPDGQLTTSFQTVLDEDTAATAPPFFGWETP